MKIDVIIPAFNEADRVGRTIEALKTMDSIGRILVVDDGSSDATSTVAMAAGAEVIRFNKNRGSLQLCLLACLNPKHCGFFFWMLTLPRRQQKVNYWSMPCC